MAVKNAENEVVWGHSRSSPMPTFNRAHTTSYSTLIETMRLVEEISRFFVIFQMAAAAILNFQKFEILMVFPLQGANMRHHAKFHLNRSNG